MVLYFGLKSSFYCLLFFFFFNDTATTEIYTLSLHDALPIWPEREVPVGHVTDGVHVPSWDSRGARSEEHTSELQSRPHLVCRLLLEKKKKNTICFLFLKKKKKKKK